MSIYGWLSLISSKVLIHTKGHQSTLVRTSWHLPRVSKVKLPHTDPNTHKSHSFTYRTPISTTSPCRYIWFWRDRYSWFMGKPQYPLTSCMDYSHTNTSAAHSPKVIWTTSWLHAAAHPYALYRNSPRICDKCNIKRSRVSAAAFNMFGKLKGVRVQVSVRWESRCTGTNRQRRFARYFAYFFFVYWNDSRLVFSSSQ